MRGTGSLVRLGARSPGWEAVATDYLELLVALAGRRGQGEVEAAVVGGLAAVVALVRPTALREGSRFLPNLNSTANTATVQVEITKNYLITHKYT